MKNLLLILITFCFIVSSCKDDSISQTNLTLTSEQPQWEGVEHYNISGKYTLRNISNGQIIKLNYGGSNAIVVDDGIYNITFDGVATNNSDKLLIRGSATDVQVFNGEASVSIPLFFVNENRGFAIVEIFATGTVKNESTSPYNGDQYFIIVNNSDTVLYADGMFLAESKFKSSDKFEYTPDIMAEAMTTENIFGIPGNKTTKRYPIEPGGTITICDNAIDHREYNKNSFDLSNADFEWYTSSTSSLDIDNPNVPNLDKIYCSSKTIWIANKQGNSAYVIGFMPENITIDYYIENYSYTYSRINMGIQVDNVGYKIPNSWICDAVNIGAPTSMAWLVIDKSLDAGYTYYGQNKVVTENYGKGIQRKVLFVTANGRKVYTDTNNSTYDFTPATTASKIGK